MSGADQGSSGQGRTEDAADVKAGAGRYEVHGFTAEELQELAQSDTWAALRALVEDCPEQFGGVYQDPVRPDVLVLRTVGDVTPSTAARLDRLRAEVPTPFRLQPSLRSWRYLHELGAAVAALADEGVLPSTVTQRGVSAEDNVLSVGVEHLTEQVQEFFRARFGEDVRLGEQGHGWYATPSLLPDGTPEGRG